MLRTFSKIYGLGGLRVGWTYAPENIIAVINRLRGPFNVNAAAQAAGLAALDDIAWLDKARSHNDTELPRVSTALRGLGLEVLPSVGNFVLIRRSEEQTSELQSLMRTAYA